MSKKSITSFRKGAATRERACDLSTSTRTAPGISLSYGFQLYDLGRIASHTLFDDVMVSRWPKRATSAAVFTSPA